jgi:hypothetical protein
MKKDKGAPVLTERITADTTEELDRKFQAWLHEWQNRIEMVDQRWADLKEPPFWGEVDYYFISPEFIKSLPFKTVFTLHGSEEEGEVALWQSGANICELRSENLGACDTSGYYYGTEEEFGRKFCSRQAYHSVDAAVEVNVLKSYLLASNERCSLKKEAKKC